MVKAAVVTSPANPLLKDLRRAVHRGALTTDGLLVAETFHLLEEALRSDLPVPAVIAAERVRSAVEAHIRGLRGIRLTVVPDDLFDTLGSAESAQGVIALVRLPEWKLEQLFSGTPLVIVLDGLQDPGNAGAIVRAAEAFGASGLLFLKGAVSPFNAKAVRASAGSLFRLPFLTGLDADLAKAAFRQRRLRLYAADAHGTVPLNHADLRVPAALLIGSEAHGLSSLLDNGCQRLRIPTRGVESLNAALAAGVLLYEASRQRTRA
jgi:RNA methyltransferase, TrmH family